MSLALAAHRQLSDEGILGRLVSMPSWELFEAQPAEYRNAVLPPLVRARVSVEAASPLGGIATSGPPVPSSAWITSAPRRQDRW
jgi:transketolase